MKFDSRRRMGWIGFAVLIALFAVGAILLLPQIKLAREMAHRAACQGTLKQWGTIFSMYAKEWDSWYPRMQGPSPWLVDGITTAELGKDCGAEEGFRLTPNPPSVFPEYATTLEVLRCPSNDDSDLKVIRQGCKYAGMPTRGDESFQYLGYAFVSGENEHAEWNLVNVTNETLVDELRTLFAEVLGQVKEDSSPARMAQVLGSDITSSSGASIGSSKTLHRLRETVERLFIADFTGPTHMSPHGFVPVMWDKVGPVWRDTPDSYKDTISVLNHLPGGSNVLYEDGHVEFRLFSANGKFPVNVVLPEVLQKSGLGAK